MGRQSGRNQPVPPATALPNFYLLLWSHFGQGYLVLPGHRVDHHIPTRTEPLLLFPPFPWEEDEEGTSAGEALQGTSPASVGRGVFAPAVGFLSMNHSKCVRSWETTWYFWGCLLFLPAWSRISPLTPCNLYVLASLISATLIPKLTLHLRSSFHGQAAWRPALRYQPNTAACFNLSTYAPTAEYTDEKAANQTSSSHSPAPRKQPSFYAGASN